jgi:hypothetical protein
MSFPFCSTVLIGRKYMRQARVVKKKRSKPVGLKTRKPLKDPKQAGWYQAASMSVGASRKTRKTYLDA